MDTGISDDFQFVHTYSRKEALQDGVLFDVSHLASEAGFKYPVAVSDALFNRLTPTDQDESFGQSFDGRLWDILMILRTISRKSKDESQIDFYVHIYENRKLNKMDLKAICHAGDDLEPVITIMFPEED